MRERSVELRLSKKVKELGGFSFKWTSPAQRGVPDRIVLINSQVWFVELKSPTGTMSKLQEFVAMQILQHTKNYVVLSTIEEVDNWVEKVAKNVIR